MPGFSSPQAQGASATIICVFSGWTHPATQKTNSNLLSHIARSVQWIRLGFG
jgi:hypothetical protein